MEILLARQLLDVLKTSPWVVSGAVYPAPAGGYKVLVYDLRNRRWEWETARDFWTDLPFLIQCNQS